MNAAAVMAAVQFVEKYGPMALAANRGRKLLGELRRFIDEHRNTDGLTVEERDRIDAVLALKPGDVRL
jgi:hypothetical protein